VADRAAIMVHGTIKSSGLPEELAGELQLAYLGGGAT
jgi:ABC-type branched-subunit amino acid transport system ATPase component